MRLTLNYVFSTRVTKEMNMLIAMPSTGARKMKATMIGISALHHVREREPTVVHERMRERCTRKATDRGVGAAAGDAVPPCQQVPDDRGDKAAQDRRKSDVLLMDRFADGIRHRMISER